MAGIYLHYLDPLRRAGDADVAPCKIKYSTKNVYKRALEHEGKETGVVGLVVICSNEKFSAREFKRRVRDALKDCVVPGSKAGTECFVTSPNAVANIARAMMISEVAILFPPFKKNVIKFPNFSFPKPVYDSE
jgi:hypothetical protein